MANDNNGPIENISNQTGYNPPVDEAAKQNAVKQNSVFGTGNAPDSRMKYEPVAGIRPDGLQGNVQYTTRARKGRR